MQIRRATRQDAPAIAAVVHAMKELRSVADQPVETTASTIAANLERMLVSESSAAYCAHDQQCGQCGLSLESCPGRFPAGVPQRADCSKAIYWSTINGRKTHPRAADFAGAPSIARSQGYKCRWKLAIVTPSGNVTSFSM